MSAQTQLFDIVIVGAGLVGSTLAALLGSKALVKTSLGKKLGEHAVAQPLSIALIDANAAPPLSPTGSVATADSPALGAKFDPKFDARVVALNHASQQLLAQVGAWSTIQSQRVCPYREMFVWDDEGTANIHFRAEDINSDCLGYIVESQIASRAIFDSLQTYPAVHSMHGVGLENMERHPTGLLLQLTDGRSLSAPLVIAADGAHSKVREWMEFRVREWPYHQRAIVATVRCQRSHQFTAWQNFLTSGPLAFLPLDHPGEHYCSIVWSLHNEGAEYAMSLADQQFSDNLSRAFQYRLGRIEAVDQRYCFPLKQRHAVDYTAANIALVGDAAHTIHPLAGQGVNLGLSDVGVLADEIERALKRGLPLSDTSLLKRYQRQRKIYNLETMAVVEVFKRLFGSRDPALRWLRNSGLRHVSKLAPLKNWLAKQAMGFDGGFD